MIHIDVPNNIIEVAGENHMLIADLSATGLMIYRWIKEEKGREEAISFFEMYFSTFFDPRSPVPDDMRADIKKALEMALKRTLEASTTS